MTETVDDDRCNITPFAWHEIEDSCTNLSELQALCRRWANQMGWPHFLLSCRFFPSGQPRAPQALTSLDPMFMSKYMKRAWGAVDGLQKKGAAVLDPFAWSITDFTSAACDISAGFEEHGILGGMVIPFHGPHGTGFSFMLCGENKVNLNDPAELLRIKECRKFLKRIYMPTAKIFESKQPTYNLRKEDLQVIQMFAHGASIKVAADTLGKSNKAITNALHRVCKELKVSSREEAIGILAQNGSISVVGPTDEGTITLSGL